MKPVIAKYLRISDEDIDLDGVEKHESNSVGNQRSLLDNFIANSPEFADYEIAEYLDDGRTGTNFSRRGVQELIEAAKNGRIQCIVVKDLSRWGRSYLEVGDFLEQKFPAWGVRFISIGDMYDSAKLSQGATGGIDMAFRGLIAQMYSQDLSEKVRAGKDAASRNGKIVTSQPTYGYDIDKNDRHKFVINQDEASIVRRVYSLYEQGHRVAEIVRILNADNIPTPQASKRAKGYDSKAGRGDCWGKGAVRLILREEKYTGKWIYGKARVSELGGRRAYPVPRSEWIIVDGAIPAIITDEQFARVQAKLRESVNNKGDKGKGKPRTERAMFARKIKCGSCGRGMAYHALKAGRIYQCSMRNQSRDFSCNTGRIAEQDIYDAVLNTIQIHVRLTQEEKARRADAAKSDMANEQEIYGKIRAAQIGIEKSKIEKMALWEEFHNGGIAKEAFQDKSSKLTEQISQYEHQAILLESKLHKPMTTSECNDIFMKRYGQLNGINSLSKELVCELVKEIRIYDPEHIEIIWSYGDPFAK